MTIFQAFWEAFMFVGSVAFLCAFVAGNAVMWHKISNGEDWGLVSCIMTLLFILILYLTFVIFWGQ